jgi:transposase/quinol monooxygenase YgiN
VILRVFQARLKPGRRAAYEQLCRATTFPMMRAAPGCLAVQIAASTARRPEELVIVSVWKDLASVRAFVGERWEEVLILPGEAELMEEARVQHFDESYRSLVAMRRALADAALRNELAVTSAPLSETQWERIRPLLPASERTGRPRADDRRTLEGILYVLRTGCRWHDLPAAYGSAVTCWRRFTQWEADGTWEQVWHELLGTLDTQGKLAWAQAFLDSRFVPTKRGTRQTGRVPAAQSLRGAGR